MSEDLIPLYKELADEGSNFHGLSVIQHSNSINAVARKCRAKTLLDYGCGRGDAYKKPYKIHRTWGFTAANIFLYDPAFAGRAALPTRLFDLVVCSDVLEHIPEQAVPVFIQRLFGYAKKHVWASVCCRSAKKFFKDGRNLHVTVQPFEWWQAQFKQHATKPFTLIETP